MEYEWEIGPTEIYETCSKYGALSYEIEPTLEGFILCCDEIVVKRFEGNEDVKESLKAAKNYASEIEKHRVAIGDRLVELLKNSKESIETIKEIAQLQVEDEQLGDSFNTLGQLGMPFEMKGCSFKSLTKDLNPFDKIKGDDCSQLLLYYGENNLKQFVHELSESISEFIIESDLEDEIEWSVQKMDHVFQEYLLENKVL